MSTSSPFRLVPDHMRDADATGDLEAFLSAAWSGGLAPALAFLMAADPDILPLAARWGDSGILWGDGEWTWAGTDADGITRTSQPVDPAYAPSAWLPWLARLLGADITGLTAKQARWYLGRRGRSAVGSDNGMKDAVGATLSGARTVVITTPSVWEMTVTVANAEVVDIAVTLAVAQRNKPSGVDLTVELATPVTLADLAATYDTLADITATGKTLDQLRFG